MSRPRLKGPWRELERVARDAGWTVSVRKGGHLLWQSPDGRKVFSSASASDPRAARNHRTQLRRHGLEGV